MEKRNGVKLALVASGSGTDADAIMQAWKAGFLPEVDELLLISTKEGAGCVAKAEAHDINYTVIPCKGPAENTDFNRKLGNCLRYHKNELVFLVGCVHRVHPIAGVDIYNIHPADPHQHGGQGMYGLKVHEHVLLKIQDAITRGKAVPDDHFYTHPTIHEVVEEYDAGSELLIGSVEIPTDIVKEFIAGKKDDSLVAERLQQHVLQYEWLILPTAVRMAAKKIIDRRTGG